MFLLFSSGPQDLPRNAKTEKEPKNRNLFQKVKRLTVFEKSAHEDQKYWLQNSKAPKN